MKFLNAAVVGFLGVLCVSYSMHAELFGQKASQLDVASSLSRDIDRLLRTIQDNNGQGLSTFALGEYASIFLTEKAHELVFRAYKDIGQEPALLSIADPAYKTAQMLLHQSFMSRLRPQKQSPQDIIQTLNDVVDNDTGAILAAIRASLNISAIKAEKLDYLSKLEDAQAQVKALKTKISDLQKTAEPAKPAAPSGKSAVEKKANK